MITDKSKTIAEYMGWVYVPSTELVDFKKAGWYRPCGLFEKGSEPYLVDGKNYKYECRNHNQLRFYNDLNLLFRVVSKIEKEDLRHYCYKWESGDEQHFNFMGLEFIMFHGRVEFEIHFELDPSDVISKRDLNYNTLSQDLFEVVFETISWINNVKLR